MNVNALSSDGMMYHRNLQFYENQYQQGVCETDESGHCGKGVR